MTDLEQFTIGYIEALYFADTGDDDQPSSDAELSSKALTRITEICKSWWATSKHLAIDTTCPDEPPAILGKDFYLTHNGHGAGWENDELLIASAENYSELNLYQGDDGLIYVE